MFKNIHYIQLEENNIYIGYAEAQKALWLTPEGGDLNDFAEFLEALCPGFDIETLEVEEAICLQHKLYQQLQDRIRQTLSLELAKFGRCLEDLEIKYPSP